MAWLLHLTSCTQKYRRDACEKDGNCPGCPANLQVEIWVAKMMVAAKTEKLPVEFTAIPFSKVAEIIQKKGQCFVA